MKWGRDLKAEAGLKLLGISFEVIRVALRDVNTELSMERQARIGKKINDDWVLEYAEAMQNGAEFPMPILQKMSKQQYFIWSGNHRTNSAKLIGETEIDCYVVRVTDLRLMDVLPRVVNTWEGHRETREAILEHAKFVVEKHALGIPEVAKMFGLKEEWLSVAVRANGVAKAIEECGVKGEFPKTTLLRLSPLQSNKNVLKAACKLLKDYDIAGDKMVQVLNDVKLADTEHKQLAEISRWRKLNEDRKPAKSPTPLIVRGKRTRIIDLLTSLERFLDGVTLPTQLQLDDSDVQIVAGSWNKIARKMEHLMKGGGK